MLWSPRRSAMPPDMTLPRTKPARFQTRRRIIVGLPAAVVLACLASGLPLHCNAADATTRADQRFTSYAFAHEFGSGIYDFNGRTLQVYSLPMGWNVIEPGKDQTGLRLRLPVTLGFLDFKPADVIESGLPDRADSVSFVPGVELNFVAGRWRLLPYVQAGRSTASRSNVESDLFGTGIRAEREFAAGNFAGLYAAAATYSHVSYRGDGALPDDDFMRLRNSVEFRRGTGFVLDGHPIEYGLFATIDVFTDPPTGPTTGVDVPREQFEAGVVLGARPAWKIWRIPLPRVGLSYRFAGDVSAVRVVLGAPF